MTSDKWLPGAAAAEEEGAAPNEGFPKGLGILPVLAPPAPNPPNEAIPVPLDAKGFAGGGRVDTPAAPGAAMLPVTVPVPVSEL